MNARTALLSATCALLALSLLPLRVEAGACAGPFFHPVLLTRRLPREGGLLVGIAATGTSLVGLASTTPFDALVPVAHDDGGPLAFRREELAPGLSLFVPERAITGTLAVESEAGPTTLTVPSSRRARALPTPRIRAIGPVRGSLGGLAVTLGARFPASAAVMIVHGYDAAGVLHPISWVALEGAPDRTVMLPIEGGRCSPLNPVFESPLNRPDPRLAVSFVGDGGRQSPLSDAVRVEPPLD